MLSSEFSQQYSHLKSRSCTIDFTQLECEVQGGSDALLMAQPDFRCRVSLL